MHPIPAHEDFAIDCSVTGTTDALSKTRCIDIMIPTAITCLQELERTQNTTGSSKQLDTALQHEELHSRHAACPQQPIHHS